MATGVDFALSSYTVPAVDGADFILGSYSFEIVYKIKLGDLSVTKMYLGDSPVVRSYLGDVQISG